MRITVTLSGGFAGLRSNWSLEIEQQPDRENWQQLVESLPWDESPKQAPQPDRYVYRIEWSRRQVILTEQQLTGPWRVLVDRVRDRTSA